MQMGNNKPPVYAVATNITSALGADTAAHWQAASALKSGVEEHTDSELWDTPFFASRLSDTQWQSIYGQTPGDISNFERLAVFSAQEALKNYTDKLVPAETIVILSTTKGNIELLGQATDEELKLHHSARTIASQLGYDAISPVVVSNACVSGVAALTYGLRLLQNGNYKNAIVIGCDKFTKFVFSGFQSFRAVADEPCRPFDAERKGINLGEAAATIILSVNDTGAKARLLSGSSSNDANHISGPSRTGEELALAIDRALNEAGITAEEIGMLSAHGTATPYNDEMEAKAFGIAGLTHTPTHSFKGFTGHTLGAAGVLESAMIIEAITHQQVIPSPGFKELGVSQALNITTAMQPAEINYVLKTASGFGGCNATAVWGKI